MLIKLNATGICYSDIHYMLNDTGGKKMSASGICSAGHEGSGVVVKLGENVKTFQLGDRAGVKPIWYTCGSCNLCWGGKEVHCPQKVLTGVGATGKTALEKSSSFHFLIMDHRNLPTLYCFPSSIHHCDSKWNSRSCCCPRYVQRGYRISLHQRVRTGHWIMGYNHRWRRWCWDPSCADSQSFWVTAYCC